jgi:predicted ribonuclease toxin of YeeF-YezG toxin-antitoxin module
MNGGKNGVCKCRSEQITGYKVDKTQIPHLKEVLKKYQFGRLSTKDSTAHRKVFNNLRDDLRMEWEQKTGQKWPLYKETIYGKTGKKLRKIGDPLDAHHIIPVSHAGPNEWWNIYPTLLSDHQVIHHNKDAVFKNIFDTKKTTGTK